MANVYVEYNGNIVGTTVDFDGKFILKPLQPGLYDVTFSYVGRPKQVIKSVQVNPNSMTFLKDLVMPTSNLPEFIVEEHVYEAPLINIEDPVKIHLGRLELLDSPNKFDPIDMVDQVSSEIKKGPDQQLYFRGSRSSSVVYFIDGVKVFGEFNGVPGNSIRSMTVYTGGMPAKYGDTLGGVVALETMSYHDMLRMRNMGLE